MRLAAFAALSAALITVIGAVPVQASYPGQNGTMAFASVGSGGKYDIFMLSADASRVLNVTKSRKLAESNPSLSPSGKHMAWTVCCNKAGLRDVIVFNMKNGNFKNITLTMKGVGACQDPTWSPNGKRLAFGCEIGRLWKHGIFTTKPDGSERKRITVDGEGDAISKLDWAAAGGKIAYQAHGNGDVIKTVPASGGTPTELPVPDSYSYSALSPSWSPDGNQIVFSHFTSQLYVMNANGTNLRPLTAPAPYSETRAEVFDPSWSPDNEKIAFVSDWLEGQESSNHDIYTMDAPAVGETPAPVNLEYGSTDGGSVERYKRRLVDDRTPDWSPLP